MTDIYHPHILYPSQKKDKQEINRLIQQGICVVDELAEQQKELFYIKNPKKLGKTIPLIIKDSLLSPHRTNEREHGGGTQDQALWVYYPWRNTIVHILPQKDFEKLRISRNQNLITQAEQKMYSMARVGIAGLNVGNPAAICLALESGGLEMKMADNDVLSVTNLNRFRASLCDLGLNKATLSARQVYEINPFANVSVWEGGIGQGREDEFLLKPKIDVLIEEMDALPLKISIRERAKYHKIPVVMVTGNGSGLILDVERYDIDPALPLLNGLVPAKILETIQSGRLQELDVKSKIGMARDFVGKQYLDKRLLQSFEQVCVTLAGIPQLAEASFLRGAVLAYAIRQIVTKSPMPSGRYSVRLDEFLS